jgi:amidase
MVPLAFGTQTGGSIIRPASFCGVYGYKPTYDTIAVTGVKPLAPGLDTVGCFARNLDDIAWFGAALSGGEPIDIPPWSGAAPRVGLTRTYEWSHAEAATVEAVETAAARLDEAGAKLTEVNLPPYRDPPAARIRCLLYPQLRTFSLPSLTSGFDPQRKSRLTIS